MSTRYWALLDVLPGLPTGYVTDCSVADAVSASNAKLCFAVMKCKAYFAHVLLCQLRPRMCFSAQLASLAYLVLHVIGIRSNKQVLGPTASGIIAMVADLHTFWNQTVSQLIGITMRQDNLLHFWRNRYSQLPVSLYVTKSGPVPTFAALVNACPKTFIERLVTIVAMNVAGKFSMNTMHTNGLSTAAGTRGGFCGRMLMHSEPHFRCVWPWAVLAVPGLCFAFDYSTNARLSQLRRT